MNNIMKKSIIFVLLGLMAQPAYPGFGMDTVPCWGRGALSGVYEAVKNHPWLTGLAVSTVVLGVAGYNVLCSIEGSRGRNRGAQSRGLEKLSQSTQITSSKNDITRIIHSIRERAKKRHFALLSSEEGKIQNIEQSIAASNIESLKIHIAWLEKLNDGHAEIVWIKDEIQDIRNDLETYKDNNLATKLEHEIIKDIECKMQSDEELRTDEEGLKKHHRKIREIKTKVSHRKTIKERLQQIEKLGIIQEGSLDYGKVNEIEKNYHTETSDLVQYVTTLEDILLKNDVSQQDIMSYKFVV